MLKFIKEGKEVVNRVLAGQVPWTGRPHGEGSKEIRRRYYFYGRVTFGMFPPLHGINGHRSPRSSLFY